MITAAILLAALQTAPAGQVVEPKSGVAFAATQDGMTLAGVGLRTKTMLKVKVYAVGLYVADSAAAGFKGKAADAAANEAMWGDYPKLIVMKFTRDLSADQIRGAFEEVLGAADASRRAAFLGYFDAVKEGQEARLRWAPGGTLEVTVAGLGKPPIADKNFAAAVYGIWLGPKAIQDDIKRGLVSRLQ